MIDVKTGDIEIARHKSPYSATSTDDISMGLINNPWDRGVLKKFLLDFALIPEPTANVSDESFVLTFRKDEMTQMWCDPADPEGTIGFTNMVLDIHPKRAAEENAERLRKELQGEAGYQPVN